MPRFPWFYFEFCHQKRFLLFVPLRNFSVYSLIFYFFLEFHSFFLRRLLYYRFLWKRSDSGFHPLSSSGEFFPFEGWLCRFLLFSFLSRFSSIFQVWFFLLCDFYAWVWFLLGESLDLFAFTAPDCCVFWSFFVFFRLSCCLMLLGFFCMLSPFLLVLLMMVFCLVKKGCVFDDSLFGMFGVVEAFCW